LDCFGENTKTGKIGTDIEEVKCTLLFVKAEEACKSDEERINLGDTYKSAESSKVDKMKQSYTDLGLPQIYAAFDEEWTIFWKLLLPEQANLVL